MNVLFYIVFTRITDHVFTVRTFARICADVILFTIFVRGNTKFVWNRARPRAWPAVCQTVSVYSVQPAAIFGAQTN